MTQSNDDGHVARGSYVFGIGDKLPMRISSFCLICSIFVPMDLNCRIDY
jgi:hypothetical protein